jgi:hypothetical protein
MGEKRVDLGDAIKEDDIVVDANLVVVWSHPSGV